MTSIPVIVLAFANDREDGNQYLRNLPKEQRLIREALTLAQEAGLCEVVERPSISLPELMDILQHERYRDRIAIFHYGGHANSYQLLLESLEGEVATAGGEGLSRLFSRRKGLKLVFLNGCSTEMQAKALTEAGIPLVVGTRRVINDKIATQLAQRFYQGLGKGLNIDQAWRDAQDEIQTQEVQDGGFRSIFLEEEDFIDDQLPWNLYQKDGASQLLNWNLPEAAKDPLFGLPPLPHDIDYPRPPYLYLQRYDRAHARLFAGRASYIRQLYNLIMDRQGPFLIHLYGASGAGKSSLLEAGLLPRLESQAEIQYMRRDGSKQAAQLIQEALKSIYDQIEPENTDKLQDVSDINEALKQLSDTTSSNQEGQEIEIETLKSQAEQLVNRIYAFQKSSQRSQNQISDIDGWKQLWLSIEFFLGKPLVLILDQLESIFISRDISQQKKEWEDLLNIFQEIMQGADRPKGKLILAYRKEYHPEIEGYIKTAQLSYQSVFLDKLNEESVIEIVHRLGRPEFESIYHLEVENGLGQLIANEVLKHDNQSVAPVLQILLTRMWEVEAATGKPHLLFSEKLYHSLSRQGLLLKSFFEEQMQILTNIYPKHTKSGLILDILHVHTTPRGTATSNELVDLKEAYSHIPEFSNILNDCISKTFLMRQEGSQSFLMHDTLAPVVREAYHQSEAPGQRATRMLESRVNEGSDEKVSVLGEVDLQYVKEGKNGMRKWTLDEQRFIQHSTVVLQAQKRRQKLVRYALISLLVLFLGASTWGSWSFWKYNRTYGDLQIIEGELETAQQTLIDKKDSIQQITAFLAQRETDIQRLEEVEDSLLGANDAIQSLSNQNRRKLQSNQLAVQSNRTPSPFEAFSLAKNAYQLEPQNPWAVSALMKAYQQRPFSKIVNPDRVGEVSALYPVSLQGGILSVKDENGQELFRMPFGEDNFETTDGKVSISADGKYLVALPDILTVKVWNRDGEMIQLPTNDEFIETPPVFLKQNENLLLVADSVAWDIQEDLFQPPVYRGNVKQIAAFPDAGKWVIGSKDSIKIWDKSYQRTLKSWQLSAPLKNMALSPDAQYIASMAGTQLQLFNISGHLMGTFDNNNRDVYQIAFSPNGKYLLSAESEHQAVVWDTENQQSIATLQEGGQNWRTLSANFSPNGRWVVTASTDTYIRIWDWQSTSPKLLAKQALAAAAQQIIFDPSGQYIICTDSERNLYVWHWQQTRLKLKAKVRYSVAIQQLNIRPSKQQLDIWVQGEKQSSLLRFSPADNYFYELFVKDQNVVDASFSTDGNRLWFATDKGIQAPLLLEPSQMIRNVGF